ncbi:primosomal protein N' [Sansalvadorimonas sp. 2012CJ34-2]|uniref:Replication restart protein PriA n=1 Tax=Parendozoicomonas callyspongiae TaxID=2942213 RepID=A0ABT0PJE3_9GAMM|nr:primosomal protein N' [Sansalvadorimonas sp. 2012CJ34-2]MCL6270598.1 primosomal protein N' [Sansalvadorimonas sp. 2012CJ34-2]
MSEHSAGILRIALPVSLRRLFDYLPPKSIPAVKLTPGLRVRVPFRNREIVGVLISLEIESEVPADKLRPASEILDSTPVLSEQLMKLALWTADYYHHPAGDTLIQALPALLRQGYDLGKEVHNFWQPASNLDNQAEIALAKARAPKQQEAWELIRQHPDGISTEALRSFGFEKPLLRNLEKRGLVESLTKAPQYQMFYDHHPLLKSSPLVLNSEQERALEAVICEDQSFSATLLHGVTGSGKTEVYLQAIAHVLSQQKQALLLVPEIGLTPQTLARFRERFNVPVCVLHSGLTDRERLNGWLAAQRGEAGIVISTRSGIFTPLYSPGIIIVDEEHDLSYKQQDSVRYSSRDLALYRGRLENIPVILGSATPSLETLNNSISHRFRYLKLSQRAGVATPPQLELIDTRGQELQGGIAPESLHAIKDTLQQGHQALVFLNRRGYAPTLTCDHCGWLVDCPNCDAHLTLHRSPPHLHCHHCDYRQGIPNCCPNCSSIELSPVGQGTERTEEILAQLFPKTQVLRIDRDSMRKKHAFQETIDKIHKGDPAILVGTQMLAKGHHFPAVTLVVIVNADAGFFSADFRGSEKTGQLILQVAGRAGRADRPGRVFIQTGTPDNEQLQTLIHKGYDDLSKELLDQRRSVGLPPFSYMALISAEATFSQPAEEFLVNTANLAKQIIEVDNLGGPEGVLVLGPMPAPMEKRQGRMRYHLHLQAKTRKPLHNMLYRLLPLLEQDPLARKIRWSVDIDPQDMS